MVQWRELVPTWYLRALFVTVVVVGGVERLIRRVCGEMAGRVLTCALFAGACLTQHLWAPEGRFWDGFLVYGLPVYGCAWFAVGMLLGRFMRRLPDARPSPASAFLRRQMMPVYLLHALVLIVCGWVARALHCYDRLTTPVAGIVLWTVAVISAMLLGEALRCLASRSAACLFGGRG